MLSTGFSASNNLKLVAWYKNYDCPSNHQLLFLGLNVKEILLLSP